MLRISDPYRLFHTTKPGRANKFKPDGRRMMREAWADYCTNHCPHPEARCEKRPCAEFRARFGRVDDV